MVKVRGRNSNGKTVKQTVKNGRKISGDDAARPAWVTGARRQQFAAASRFWSIPNLMPRSTVTHWMSSPGSALWYTDIWQSFFFFLWELFDKTVTEYRVWLGGSGIKKRGGGVATAHHCILRCLTRLVFEESRSHACVEHAYACMLHESCCDGDYALHRICTSSAPYLSHQTRIRSGLSGFASARPEPGKRTRCRWRLARWERAQKRAVFMSLDTRGYIRKYCHWTGEEWSLQQNAPLPFWRCGRIPRKNQTWCWSWPC